MAYPLLLVMALPHSHPVQVLRPLLPRGEHQRAQTAHLQRWLCHRESGPVGSGVSVESSLGGSRGHCVQTNRTAEGCLHQPQWQAAEGPDSQPVHQAVHEQGAVHLREPEAVWPRRGGERGPRSAAGTQI